MSREDPGKIPRRPKLLGLEIIGGLPFFLALVIYIWALNEGSELQTVFLRMIIILVALSIAGVEILVDARRLSSYNVTSVTVMPEAHVPNVPERYARFTG